MTETPAHTKVCDACKKPIVGDNFYSVNEGTTTGALRTFCGECAVKFTRPSTWTRPEPKVGRNEPCTCGSGVKYKKCCGK